MPRRARMYISGFPYHVVQRGNNREACFFEIEDYQFYLDLLQQLLFRYGVHLHAYVLMTNHVHLLMTPEEKDSISNMTRVLGSRFAQYMNKKYQRTGTLWEGRHKSSGVDRRRPFVLPGGSAPSLQGWQTVAVGKRSAAHGTVAPNHPTLAGSQRRVSRTTPNSLTGRPEGDMVLVQANDAKDPSRSSGEQCE